MTIQAKDQGLNNCNVMEINTEEFGGQRENREL